MSIICGTDLTPVSLHALDAACALASQRGDDEVVLVHAIADERDAEAKRRALDAFAANAAGSVGAARPVAIRAEIVIGDAAEAMITFAETEGSDLIVVSASSQPPTLIRLGSTAEKLVVASHVPVLIVRDPDPWQQFASGERTLRVLLGIDDSVACELGMQWSHALRARGAVEVVLGAVYYPDDAAEHYGFDSTHKKDLVDRDPEIEKLLVRDMLRKYGTSDRVEARALVGLGRIGDHVIELATQTNVDAIIVGTTQKTGLDRLGSVSSVIVHNAPQSVVCVPPNANIPTMLVPRIQSALVATDLSTFANRAVPFAFSMTDEGGEVHIAHVVERDDTIDEPETLRALTALAPQSMPRAVSAHILRGDDPARAIAQAAARLGVDAICIASHGRSGIKRAVVGSVADKLLRATRKPVLVLRPS